MTSKLKAFVIMPFDEEFTSIYETLIKPPLVEVGYEVLRADSLLNQENILRAIIRGISTADLLVADLTTNNANVFYELGLAHALRIPTVLLAQSIADVPFDLRSYKIHIYDTHFKKVGKLKEFLKKVSEQHANKDISFGNPVEDFSEAGKAKEPEESPVRSMKAEPADAVAKELWDFIVEGEKAGNDLTSILNRLLRDNQTITDRFKKHSGTIEALRSDPTIGSARRFHKVFLLAASDINSFAGKVEGQLPLLEQAVERINENYSGFIQTVDASRQEAQQALRDLHRSINNLLQIATGARTATGAFRQASLDLVEMKLSKDLSRASRRQAEALKGVISNIQRLEAFCVRALAMIELKVELLVSSHDDANAPA